MGEMDDRGRSEGSDGLFRTVSHDLIDLMAYFKMVTETRHILSRCEGADAIVVEGSDLKLRLEILAIYELLKSALYVQDRANPSTTFESLVEMVDSLATLSFGLASVVNDAVKHAIPFGLASVGNDAVKYAISFGLASVGNNAVKYATHMPSLKHMPTVPICTRASDTEQSMVVQKWPEMRTRLVRQAALSVLRLQEKAHQGPVAFDWSDVSTDEYISTVDRLLPPVDEDMDALHDEEKITAAKERRNLMDIFLERRGGVHACKVLALLRENNLAIFEKDMTAFIKELESTILPLPKILQLYRNCGFLDEGVDGMEDANGYDVDVLESPRKRAARRRADPSDGSPKRRRLGPSRALALLKANESLQREIRNHSSYPGTLAEALALGESVLDSRSPGRKGTGHRGEAAGGRSTSAESRSKYITTQNSPGEQVSFDDSQSMDEPHPFPRTLQNHPTPPKGPALRSTASTSDFASKKTTSRVRVPWTEEEVMHLNAAVKALGKGKWALALSQYKFQECRTSVDLKDKWRNLNKDKD